MVREITRRRVIKAAGCVVTLATIPMVHAAPRAERHPHWDMVMDHVGQNYPKGAEGLREWITTLVQCPDVPQHGLLLVGPQSSGKTMFHESASLLLPEGTTWKIEMNNPEVADHRLVCNARLLVLEGGHPDHPLVRQVYSPHRQRDGRYLKYVHCTQHPPELPNKMRRVDLPPLRTGIDRDKLLRYLEDERDAFVRTIEKYDPAWPRVFRDFGQLV